MVHEHDIKALEHDVRCAFISLTAADNSKTRTNFFKSVRELTLAILIISKKVGKETYDPDEIAYEYAIYLFERVITGKFKPKAKISEFPWTKYIRLNSKHIIFSLHKKDSDWESLLHDFQFFVDSEPEFLDLTCQLEKPLDDAFFKKETSKQVFKAIQIYYSTAEVKRLLPMAMELIMVGGVHAYSDRVPRDLRDFCITLVSVAKRLTKGNDEKRRTTNVDSLLKSSLRSSLFLSAVSNSDFFPKELLLTLDINSLSRLVQVCGGKTIRIPYAEELDSLLCAVVAVSRIITEGKEIESAISGAKTNLTLTRQINIQEFVSKLVATFSLFEEDEATEPLVNLLVESVKSLEKTLGSSRAAELKGVLANFSEAINSVPKTNVGGVTYG